MNSKETKTPSAVIHRYIENCVGAQLPISISEAVSTVRRDLPDTDLRDKDLAAMVTIAAVLADHAVSFDSDLAIGAQRP